ncbi:MAG: peptidoglycan editing factor PgeF [Anaerolineae bacterium]|nr:peptidoglycan editing factor PgeF [Anaerolineae bacterium]
MIRSSGEPPYFLSELGQADGLVHGIFTRLGGTSQGPWHSLNVGHTVGDDPEHVDANLASIYAALNIDPAQVVTGRQVHGDHVGLVDYADRGQILDATDALISDAQDTYLLLRFADCVPVLLWDPKRRAVGLVHAGWRGTLAKIAAKAVRTLVTAYGCELSNVRAVIGPSIGPCCYEVGPEVVKAARQAFSPPLGEGFRDDEPEIERLILRPRAGGKAHLDLWRANALQLRALGLRQIEVAGLCTACHPELFFSHRAEAGRTGRFAALIGWRGQAQ